MCDGGDDVMMMILRAPSLQKYKYKGTPFLQVLPTGAPSLPTKVLPPYLQRYSLPTYKGTPSLHITLDIHDIALNVHTDALNVHTVILSSTNKKINYRIGRSKQQ